MWYDVFLYSSTVPNEKKKNLSCQMKQKKNWPTKQSSGAGEGQTVPQQTGIRKNWVSVIHAGAKNMRGV